MRVLIIGGGGREAALAWRIARSPSLTSLLVVHDNPGWPALAERVDVPATVVAWVELALARGVDLVVAGPEAPLAAGIADALAEVGVPCFGPTRAAARLEASKAFAKSVMDAVGVPTAGALLVHRDDPDGRVTADARIARGQVVVKADGLAAGKGVFVCPTAEEGRAALDALWSEFGGAADEVLLEDLLEGPEVSVFGLSDGVRVVALPSAQDHKRLGDGDVGPNTGGMGAYAPCPLVDREEAQRLVDAIHLPVVRELARRGTPFRGVLYAGLMMTTDGPKVLEFNVRFGDPECQPLMCLWEDDALPWLYGAATGRLPEGQPRFSAGSACCVVLASRGYPTASTAGVPIPEPAAQDGVEVFFAGARRVGEGLVTAGGRVLGVTGTGDDLAAARDRAYAALDGWRFDGCQARSDIGWRALQ
jgi:phosphoribosylamine--glycine ligase